ncbi:uncharacterized protein DUF4154 [Breznakibacter xylanolyticus]|uniref:Uncharacterized protein DUF4154 n=2 Tax=Breznakibacter xylanolyticus TaxID=990 RepID=A0A2W7NFI9_9BACT|nr:uncharacterized protein DUF4154 [Breznakibacter xylanolyticus]
MIKTMKRKNILSAFATILFFSIFASANGQIQKHQASYIYTFTRFIEWPTQGQTEFVIGVIGKNHPLTAELKASSSGRSVGALPIKIVEYASADVMGDCHILFVPDEKSSQLKKVDSKVSNKSTIVITEEQDWVPSESTINLQIIDSKLAFNINKAQFNTKSMRVSDKLLALSK